MVNLEANMVLQEVMNSVTHGLGVVLAIVAACLLTKRAQGLPSHYVISCAVYSTALIVLYTISTLYHSFFALPTVKFIFKVIDRCAIYVLIAGSYSPFLMIALQHNEVWSMHLLLFIWACAFGGMFVEATMWHWKHKPKFSLSLYLFMGWSCLICFPDLVSVLPSNALGLLVAGGVAYTAGM
jgi:hemolysin III